MKLKVKYKLTNPKCEPEIHGNWIDLKAGETVHLTPMQFKIITLSIVVVLPKWYEINIVSRSSTYKEKKVLQTNGLAVIEDNFCGEEDIIRFPALAMEDTVINEGDRICQMKIGISQFAPWYIKVINLFYSGIELEKVDLTGKPNRGGLGHSGGYN